MKIKLEAKALEMFESFPLGITELQRRGFLGLIFNNRFLNHTVTEEGDHLFIWQSHKEYHSYNHSASPFSIRIRDKRVNIVGDHSNRLMVKRVYADLLDTEPGKVALGFISKLTNLISEHNHVVTKGRFNVSS